MRQKIKPEDRRKEVKASSYEMFKNGLFNMKIAHDFNFAVGYAVPSIQSKTTRGKQADIQMRSARINNKFVIYE